MRSMFIILALFLLSACADNKAPPLKGDRLNVLHYDLLKEATPVKTKVVTPSQIESLSWSVSDTSQFTGVPQNIKLSKNLKLIQKLSPNKFFPSTQDSGILIVGDVLYTYSKAIVTAYQISKKKMLWYMKAVTDKEINDIIGGGLAYSNGVLYVSSGTKDFIALDAHNGKELWRFKAPNVVRYIALVQGNQIYVSSIDNTISCLSLDGGLLWRYDATIYSLTTSHIYIPTILFEDKAITLTTAGDLVALNRLDGEELTQVNLATTSIIGDGSLAKGPIVSPFLDKENLYVLTGESELLKINLALPEISWRENFAGSRSFWVAGDTTYLITEDNQLLAIENNKGRLIWIVDLPKKKKDSIEIFYGPLLAGDNLIVTNADGNFYLFSPYDGKLISSYKNNASIRQMPIVVGDKLYFVSNNGSVFVWQ